MASQRQKFGLAICQRLSAHLGRKFRPFNSTRGFGPAPQLRKQIMDKNTPKISEVLGWIAAWAVVGALLFVAMHYSPILRG